MKKTLFALLIVFVTTTPLTAQFQSSIYVVNGLSETLSRIDLASGTVYEDIVALGSVPNDILIRGERAYVVNSGSNDLSVIDIAGDSVVSVVDLGQGNNPWAGVFLNDDTLYISNWLTHSVSRLDLSSASIIDTIPVGTGPEGLLIADGRLYVANSGWNGGGYDPGTVSVVDLADQSLIATIPVGLNPQDLAIDPQGEIQVVCTGDFGSRRGKIYVIDTLTDSVVDSIDTGGYPARGGISQTGLLYMAAGGWIDNGEVYLYDTIAESLVYGEGNPIRTALAAMDVVTDSEGYLYVASFAENAVSVFDMPDDSVTTYTVGSGPVALAVREEPWIEIHSEPSHRTVPRGGNIDFYVSIDQSGASTDRVGALSLLLMPGGFLYGGNPVLGPYDLTLSPNDSLSVQISETIPAEAPLGRYVLFSLARDLDSRRMTIDDFWFEVVP